MTVPLSQYFEGFPLSGMVAFVSEVDDSDPLSTVVIPVTRWVAVLHRPDPDLAPRFPNPPREECVVIPPVVLANLSDPPASAWVLTVRVGLDLYRDAERALNEAAERARARYLS